MSEVAQQTVRIGTRADEIEVVGRADGAVRPIAVPEGVTKGAFFRVVAAYDALFRAAGARPEVSEIRKLVPQLTKKAIGQVIVTDSFVEAMEARGIGFVAEEGLSPQQAAVLNVLEDFSDTRSLTSKLKSAGVSRAQYNAWLKDPLFHDLYEKRVESHLKDSHLAALGTIMSAAENGDVKAAEKVLEINGRYSPQNAELQNARAVVQSLVEAIQRHVSDPETVQAIISDVTMAQQVSRLTA